MIKNVKYLQEMESKSLKPGQAGWEPPNWREVLENIRKMRSARDAPVDNMGAEKCMDEQATPEVCSHLFLYQDQCLYGYLPFLMILSKNMLGKDFDNLQHIASMYVPFTGI